MFRANLMPARASCWPRRSPPCPLAGPGPPSGCCPSPARCSARAWFNATRRAQKQTRGPTVLGLQPAEARTAPSAQSHAHAPALTMMLNTMTGIEFSLQSVTAVSSMTFRLSKHTCLHVRGQASRAGLWQQRMEHRVPRTHLLPRRCAARMQATLAARGASHAHHQSLPVTGPLAKWSVAHAKCASTHNPRSHSHHPPVRQLVVAARVGVLGGVAVVDAVDLGGLEERLGVDLGGGGGGTEGHTLAWVRWRECAGMNALA